MALNNPDPAVFFTRNHPKDRRLGEIWRVPAPSPNVVLLGWPDDRGIAANGGRPGAAQGPDAIRKQLYKRTPGFSDTLTSLKFADFGNLKLEESISSSHAAAAKHVSEAVQKGAFVVTLGGGNDYAYADVLGLSQGLGSVGKIGVINIDAHFDLRDLQDGSTSGTPYRQLLEGNVIVGSNFVEFGIQPSRNSPEYYQYAKEKGVRVITLKELQERGVAKPFFQALGWLKQSCDAIYVSLDVDCVRQADAPGCSAPDPSGLNAADIEKIAELIGMEPAVKMISVYETAPPLDRDQQTSALAASFVWNVLVARG